MPQRSVVVVWAEIRSVTRAPGTPFTPPVQKSSTVPASSTWVPLQSVSIGEVGQAAPLVEPPPEEDEDEEEVEVAPLVVVPPVVPEVVDRVVEPAVVPPDELAPLETVVALVPAVELAVQAVAARERKAVTKRFRIAKQ